MRPKSHLRAQERERKQKWYIKTMEKLQHLSISLRPQTIRMLWIRDVVKKEDDSSQ
jgi:hypothetical protein